MAYLLRLKDVGNEWSNDYILIQIKQFITDKMRCHQTDFIKQQI